MAYRHVRFESGEASHGSGICIQPDVLHLTIPAHHHHLEASTCMTMYLNHRCWCHASQCGQPAVIYHQYPCSTCPALPNPLLTHHLHQLPLHLAPPLLLSCLQA
jgi:hypothetical protein